MKYLFIILVIGMTACKKESSFFLNQSFTVAQGTKACLKTENICLTFEKVNNDSRCPTGVMCIWEGVAEVNFTFQINETNYPFTLHTLDKLQYQKDTVIQGFTIKLEQLEPYPNSRQSINNKEYRAKVIISK